MTNKFGQLDRPNLGQLLSQHTGWVSINPLYCAVQHIVAGIIVIEMTSILGLSLIQISVVCSRDGARFVDYAGCMRYPNGGGLTAEERAKREALRYRAAEEFAAGPAAHGWAEDQRWTLQRVAALIGDLFGVQYSPRGVSKLLHRLGWSVQVPARRAVERDEDAIATWVKQTWPAVKKRPRPAAPGSVSRTRRARR